MTHVDGKLGVSETIFGDDFRFLQSCVGDATPKLTIPSPSMVHYRGGKAAIDETVYPTIDEFWNDLTAAYREEVRRLAELGCRYLQLAGRPGELAVTTHMCRGNFRSSCAAEGGYELVAEALFGELDKGKQVVLGPVTTKPGGLEDRETILRLIVDVAGEVWG